MARGFRADSGQSYASIERLAHPVRTKLAPKLPEDQALPGLGLFEALSRFRLRLEDRELPIQYEVDDLPPGVEADTRFDAARAEAVITLSSETYGLLEQGVPRARFTLCHEIGHLVLHPRELARLSHIPHERAALMRTESERPPIYYDTEWQAEAFSAALQAPAPGLALLEEREGALERDDAPRLQEQFGLSLAASEARLRSWLKRRAELLASIGRR